MVIISRGRLEAMKLYWKSYLFQCIAASATIFAILLLVSIHRKPIIIASLAASTFIVFTIPTYLTARPRNLICGHLVGLLCGIFVAELIMPYFSPSMIVSEFWYAFAVGLSIFIMVATDTEHPPAAGTALGVVTLGFSLKLLFTVLISISFLAGVHYFFRNRLRDLTL
ncbi:HPP family protein [Desulfonatronum sp. SC1]|uniref:HPP family protein n=1 Tax=Desulfonatronum sp. SC1 TaxID=2109626 RepID=UPI001E597AC2|nr:HPP family protein [Desulfonatronum sp. SC1]